MLLEKLKILVLSLKALICLFTNNLTLCYSYFPLCSGLHWLGNFPQYFLESYKCMWSIQDPNTSGYLCTWNFLQNTGFSLLPHPVFSKSKELQPREARLTFEKESSPYGIWKEMLKQRKAIKITARTSFKIVSPFPLHHMWASWSMSPFAAGELD